jgi:hypothetical protein
MGMAAAAARRVAADAQERDARALRELVAAGRRELGSAGRNYLDVDREAAADEPAADRRDAADAGDGRRRRRQLVEVVDGDAVAQLGQRAARDIATGVAYDGNKLFKIYLQLECFRNECPR